MMKHRGSLLSAALLLAGSCVGTGFYAIPIATGPAGFLAAVGITLVVWLYLLATGLLYAEATLANPDGANVITICRNLIGPTGMVLGAISFVLINYFFLSNYYTAAGELLAPICLDWFNLSLNKGWLHAGLAIIFGGVVFWGTYAADRLNFILFTGLIIAFLGTIALGAETVDIENLGNRQWYFVFFSVPFILTAFDYQSLIPTLSTYLKRDSNKLVKMICIALLFPLVMYPLWIWLIIGSTSPGMLWKAFEQKQPIEEGLALLSQTGSFKVFFHFTSFFAITTSLLTTGLAVTDFLCDAFKTPVEKRRGYRRFYACLAVFIPGLLMNLFIPTSAFQPLRYLVEWAEIVFNGVIPVWLVARARYILKLKMDRFLPGGRWMIALLIAVTFFLFYLQGVHILGGQ